MKQLALLTSIFLILTGCASTQSMTAADKESIKSIIINENITVASEMYYMGPSGGGAALMFGGLGAGFAVMASKDKAAAIRDYAAENGVLIDKIVSEELESALVQSNKFPVVEKADADSSVLNIDVYQFGFSTKSAFYKDLLPILSVKCELTDASGNVIWTSNRRILTLGNPVEGISLEELTGNPKAIENSWRLASRDIAVKMIESM